MMPFLNLTRRNALIAAHDALATTLAVLASFYLRFEGELFTERLPLLLRILPYFVVLSIVAATRFLKGAWLSIVVALVIVALFVAIKRHYDRMTRVLAVRPSEVGEDQVGDALADHHAGRIGVGPDAVGHDRGIGHPESLQAVHPSGLVHDGHRVG